MRLIVRRDGPGDRDGRICKSRSFTLFVDFYLVEGGADGCVGPWKPKKNEEVPVCTCVCHLKHLKHALTMAPLLLAQASDVEG